MKIDMNDIFDNISIENAELINRSFTTDIDGENTKKVIYNVCSRIKKEQPPKSRKALLYKLTAVATAACIALTVCFFGIDGDAMKPEPQSNPTANSNKLISKGFSVIQVYASEEKIEITDNTLETQTPFYQIQVKPCTWQEANEIIDNTSNDENLSCDYYQYGEYEDSHNGSGYIVSTTYGNYFDIKGENITSLSVTAEKGYLICNFAQNPNFNDKYIEMDKSGDVIGGGSIKLDDERLSVSHKIMWKPIHIFNYDDFENKQFDYESFSYSDLNDILSFTVTFDDNGTHKTETIRIELSFDDEGVMHTKTL